MYYNGPPGLMVDLLKPSQNGADLLHSHDFVVAAMARRDTNLYFYSNNNPLKFVDPSGLQADGAVHTCAAYDSADPDAKGNINASVKCVNGRLEVSIERATDPLTNRPWDKCVLAAIIEHETVHVRQINRWCPNWCESPCSHNGKYPGFPRDVSALDAECEASKVARDYLLSVAYDAKKRGCDPESIIKKIDSIDDLAAQEYLCKNWPPRLTLVERSRIIFGT